MKIKYSNLELKSAFGHPPTIIRSGLMISPEEDIKKIGIYIQCFNTLIDTVDACNQVLQSIDDVLNGVKESKCFGLNDESMIIYKNYIQFDIDIDDSLVDQPEGRFTHDQIRKAVEGKIKFLNMDKKVGVELIVDIYS